MQKRRTFLRRGALAGTGLILSPWLLESCTSGEQGSGESQAQSQAASPSGMFFDISLAEWSLHKTIFDGKMTNLDFPRVAKDEFGISAVEYVNQFFKDKAKDQTYLGELKSLTDGLGVQNVLIMVDGEGGLGNTDEGERKTAVENHYKWVEAAQFLGCHSIRVNAYGEGTAEEVQQAAIASLSELATFAKDYNINVIVENHGGYSSNGQWLSGVMQQVGMDNCGTLPDFGNFCIKRSQPEENTAEAWARTVCEEEYDRYQGTQELMPFAKGVSAKSHVFDAEGNEAQTDYRRMLEIVKAAGYTGYIGIEYEGSELDEYAGIRATKALLERLGAEMG
ncbi:MAG: sugar phosphate isomerase/epimerase [Bacteroidetes bacterium]|nr:MAG: sugar phosphate isomerase/epimerase [Bacteroidota bacterium]